MHIEASVSGQINYITTNHRYSMITLPFSFMLIDKKLNVHDRSAGHATLVKEMLQNRAC